MRIVSPSILSANFGELDQDIKMLNRSAAEWIHVDVMDGVFVTNISFGFPILESVQKVATKVLDVHLMIVEPEKYVERFVKAGAEYLTFHIEATDKPQECIDLIRQNGAKVGISIKPNTPVSAITELLPQLDLVLIMSVEPGYGGQGFMPESLDKIRELREAINSLGANTIIEVDGGIGASNAREVFDAGANAIVAGSSVFKSENPEQMIDTLLNI